MRHRMQGRKLGRTTAHRQATLANMAASLIKYDRIETTLPKAKELRRLADRIVTLGKKGTVAARRRAIQLIRDKRAVSKAFSDLAERYMDRAGGYTRILKLGNRRGDAAPMAVIEYLHAEIKMPAEGEKKKAKKPKKEKKEPKREAAKKEKKEEKKAPAKKAKAKKSAPKKEKKAPAKKRKSGRKVTKKKD